MIQDISYGIIPFKNNNLLIIQHNAGHWGFPKGHAENNEDPIAAASRELTEETGLLLQTILREEPFKESYQFRHKGRLIYKDVVYFLAEVTGDVTLQAEEVQSSFWGSFDEVEDKLTFDEAKGLLKEVRAWLSSI